MLITTDFVGTMLMAGDAAGRVRECSILCLLRHAGFIRCKFTKLIPSTGIKTYEV